MKVWFITGGSRGLGAAFAEAALARGDRVAVIARDVSMLGPLIEQYGEAVKPMSVDVTDRVAVSQAVQEVHKSFGSLDVVVNSAGRGVIGAIEDISEAEARAVFETNFFGPLWVCQAALPYLRDQQRGHIVNVTSLAGLIGLSMVGFSCASKWALEGMSEALAQEVAHFGINLTIIEPGFMRTKWYHDSMSFTTAPSEAYAQVMEDRLDFMSVERDLRQPGDPVRASEALLQIVDSDNPPLRLILTSDALAMAQDAYRDRLEQWKVWESVSQGIDFPSTTQLST